MNLTDLISMISFRLGNRKGLDAQIILETKHAQMRLENSPDCDWWFLKDIREVVTTDGIITLDPDVVRITDQSDIIIKPASEDRYRIAVRSFEDTLHINGEDQLDQAAYSYFGNVIRLYPTPTESTTVRLPVIKRATELTTNNLTNLWTDHGFSVLMSRTGIALAQAIQNQGALQAFTADYAAAYAELRNESVAKADSNFYMERA